MKASSSKQPEEAYQSNCLRKKQVKKTFPARSQILLPFLFALPLSFLFIFPSGPAEKIPPHLKEKLARGGNSRFTVWVYFKDKGPNLDRKILAARSALRTETLIRRLRHRPWAEVVDQMDVPVEENYINGIRPYALRVRQASKWLNALSVETTAANILAIANLPFVARIEEVVKHRFKEPPQEEIVPTPELQPTVTSHLFDYGPAYLQLTQAGIPPLHDLGLSGHGIIIALLDSGFNNLSHQALTHLLVLGTWDFVNNDPQVSDEPGQMGSGDHGAQTLGVIAGFYPGELVGPAFGANFLLAKTENTEWERHIEEDHWIAGVEWAENLGARIISSSLGYRSDFTHGEADYTWQNMDGETTVVTRGANIAASRGVLIVNSAGNEGMAKPPENTLVAPADSFWVLAVGAVDAAGLRTNFSSVGPTADGRLKPDVMAMGRSVYTVSPNKVDGYAYVSGTSFSCPLTAGAAALVLEANPTWTNQDIILALKHAASKSSSPDNFMGWGIIDASKAAFFPLKKFYPPTHFSVRRLENNFGFFKEYIDRLTWRRNERNQERIVGYRLYALNLTAQDNQFIFLAQVDSQTFHFDRRGLLAKEEFLYKITAVNESGEESDPDFARR